MQASGVILADSHSDLGEVKVLVQLEHAVVPVPDDGGLFDLTKPGRDQVDNYSQRPTGVRRRRLALTFCRWAVVKG